MRRRPRKATNMLVTREFLKQRADASLAKGYTQRQKWVQFCERMMEEGLICSLYEARQTVSKYITVRRRDDYSRSFKVRFSNHKPIKHREEAGDCDFFVGYTNLGIQTTDQAITAAFRFFNITQERAGNANSSQNQ